MGIFMMEYWDIYVLANLDFPSQVSIFPTMPQISGVKSNQLGKARNESENSEMSHKKYI